MGELEDFQVGQTVELQDGRTATVRFIGTTHFAAGDWIGVELDDVSGKNDGAVQGQRYFTCEPGHGMFVRPAVAVVVDQPTPKPTGKLNGAANGAAMKARPQSMAVGATKRQSIYDPKSVKRQSMNASSPTPGPKAVPGSLRSPSKSPTKQMTVAMPPANAASRATASSAASKPTATANKPRPSMSGRPSMGPPSRPSATGRPSQQSIAGTLDSAAKGPVRSSASTNRTPQIRTSALQSLKTQSGSVRRGSPLERMNSQSSLAASQGEEVLSPSINETDEEPFPDALSPSLSHTSHTSRALSPLRPESTRGRDSPRILHNIASDSTTHRELEDLKTKLKLMEKKRIEDREKLKALDRIQGERDKFEGIIQKLQAKYQPQQQEISDLRKQIKDAEAKTEGFEAQAAEHDTVVEMATLDREMAEETAESLKTELDALRQKQEELELEVEILREENSELGKEMSPEEKTSQGWLQIERSNERLREALMRLRDVTQEQEADLRQQIRELETDMQEFGNIKAQYEKTQEKVGELNATIDDIRQQLDTALGAEEMIEELTEKNMELCEQLEDMKTAIEDLESLKELNDELEMNHVETEKQMQDEIDYRDLVISETMRKSAAQDETIEDLEYNVARFRELVTALQSDLEDMRASQQITETQANELSNRSRAMMDLNMRLQVSASKAQVKTIDLELRRMEAHESIEHLAIVQLFLPDTFATDRDSVLAYLRFKRIGFKSSLMHGFIKERVNGQIPGHDDEVFVCCDILDKLIWVSMMCDRFVSFVRSSSVEAFNKLESALYDLEPVERAFNSWIDGLKRDELKEQHCAMELQRTIALMAHLAEVHISDGLEQYAENVLMQAHLMQSNLENTAAALSHVKSMTQQKIPSNSDDDEEDEQEAQIFLQKVDSLVSQTRGAKVTTGKAIHQLQELKTRSLTLDPSTLPTVEQSQASTSELASLSRTIGVSTFALFSQEDHRASFTHSEVTNAISPQDTSPFATFASKLHSSSAHIQKFHSLTTSLSQTVEFSSPASPPWKLLADDIRAANITVASHEEEIDRLTDELMEKNTAIAIKDSIVAEMNVKVEVLEKRVGESSGRRDKVRELEGVIEAMRYKEHEVNGKIRRLQQDVQNIEAERETWKTQVSQTGGTQPPTIPSGLLNSTPQSDHILATSLSEISHLKSEVASLQSTIRFLRLASHQASLSEDVSFLTSPLVQASKITQRQSLAQEGQGMLKDMLELVGRGECQMVKLEARRAEERLNWRPTQASSRWQVESQKEAWEEWKEWKRDVLHKGRLLRREEERRTGIRQGRDALAQITMRLPGSEFGSKGNEAGEVRIVDAEEWTEVERSLGRGVNWGV